MPKRTPTECRTCTDWRYAAVVASIEQGATLLQAAADAGIHAPSVHRHRRRCATYADRLEQAQAKRGKPQTKQGRHQAELSAEKRRLFTPHIARAVANGCTRKAAVEQANAELYPSVPKEDPRRLSANTESSWYRTQPSYRAVIERASERAQTGASQ